MLTAFPRILLLPALLLAARAGCAQYRAPSRFPAQSTMPAPALAQPRPAPDRIAIGPTILMNPNAADGLIPVEPDSARRRLYARHRVRSVLKVRLDRQGQVKDTLEYRAVDEQGRWTQAGTGTGQVRRQWSYNDQGYCTGLLEYPTPDRPYTLINTYNPTLRRGQQEVLQGNGTRTVVSERQLYQSADTLLFEVLAHPLTVGRTIYPEYYQRSLRLLHHPDTVLSLTGFYNPQQQFIGSRADYALYQHGRLTESGTLDLSQAARAQSVKLLPGQTAPLLTYHQALVALRRGEGRTAGRRWRYDTRRRLLRQESLPVPGPYDTGTTTVVHYTYNSLDQLIGQQMTSSSIRTPTRSTFTVYSYSPEGLLLGETTDARSSKAVFYRYLYQYYR